MSPRPRRNGQLATHDSHDTALLGSARCWIPHSPISTHRSLSICISAGFQPALSRNIYRKPPGYPPLTSLSIKPYSQGPRLVNLTDTFIPTILD